MEATSTSEMSINFYQPIRRNNPEDSHLQLDNSVTTNIKKGKNGEEISVCVKFIPGT
jgi:hypothetical protein